MNPRKHKTRADSNILFQVTPKPMVVPVSIRIPKSLELKLRESLIGRDGTRYRANSDLTKALESALGCNIKNFNFFMPDNSNSVKSNTDNSNSVRSNADISNSVKSNADNSSPDVSLDLNVKPKDEKGK